MSYLHCHDCHWGQDDFWHEHYSPLKSDCFNQLHKILIEGNLDEPLTIGHESMKPPPCITARQYVIRDLNRRIKIIENMIVPRKKDFNGKDFKCPECGSSNWDID